MFLTVGKVLDVINEIAPPELAESYDNVGLLAGSPDRAVQKIFVSLDLTKGSLAEAIASGAQLVVTHHPILFHARKNLREDDPEGALLCELVRSGLSLISAHTNFDNAPWGLNDALAQQLHLSGVIVLEHGMRMGILPREMTLDQFARFVRERLGGAQRVYAADSHPVNKVALCGGAGGFLYNEAADAGADVFLSGEIAHHEALGGVARGLNLVEAGHYETERVAIKALASCLQNRLNALQYKIMIIESAYEPFIGMAQI